MSAAVWVTGCSPPPPIAPPPGAVDRYTEQLFPQDPDNAVDLLFVVDDSDGMAEEQQVLIKSFPSLEQALRAPRETSPAPGATPAGRLPDLRIGVVSANLGAPGSRLTECDRSDRGRLRGPGPAGCGGAADGQFLIALDDGQRRNFAGEMTTAFGCAAALGTAGCGFEQHLGSAMRALGPEQPLENEGFLRPQALLALVILADEDDCSAPAVTDLFEPAPDRYGPQRSFRCNRQGHLCGTPGAPPMASAAPLAGCRSAEEGGKLTPVSEMVRFFRSLKSAPDRVLVSVLAGPPEPYQVQGAADEPTIAPSCQGGGGLSAAPAVRLAEFARGFGALGSFSSVCGNDVQGALGRFGERILKQLGATCLSAAPVRLAPERDPGLVDCQVTERVGTFGREAAVPRCAPGSAARPCWSLAANRDRCDASGWEVKLDHGTTPPRAGTTAIVRCRTCGDAKDPRCP